MSSDHEPVRSRYLDVGGIRTHYLDAGDGPPVLDRDAEGEADG